MSYSLVNPPFTTDTAFLLQEPEPRVVEKAARRQGARLLFNRKDYYTYIEGLNTLSSPFDFVPGTCIALIHVVFFWQLLYSLCWQVLSDEAGYPFRMCTRRRIPAAFFVECHGSGIHIL